MLKKTTSQTKLQSSNSKNLSGSNSIAYSAEISFKNKFRSLMKELLKRIEEYKIGKNKNTLDLNQLTQFLDSKIASKKGEYYDFLHEEDPILLKILIQFLYEELENILHTSKHKQYANLNNIKGLKKVINDYEKLKLSPEPLTLTRKLEKYDEKPKSLLSCLEKLNQFNDLLRNLKSYFWQILNDDIEYEKITFKTEQHKRNYVQTLEQIYDKTNKTLDNNILFLQSFSIYDDIDDEKFFDEGRLNDKLINSIEIKNGNSLINENSSPFKNISNEIGEHMKDKIIDKLEKENGILQKQLEYIRSPQKNSSPMKKSNYNEEFRNLQDENFSLKMKVEELRKEFSKISSNVIKSMSERDIQSKQILNENERLLRIKNLNNIDFQSLEQKYQQKIVDLRKEVRY